MSRNKIPPEVQFVFARDFARGVKQIALERDAHSDILPVTLDIEIFYPYAAIIVDLLRVVLVDPRCGCSRIAMFSALLSPARTEHVSADQERTDRPTRRVPSE